MQLFHVTAGDPGAFAEVDLFASSILKAVATAYEIANGQPFEVWESGRKICAVDPAADMPMIKPS